MFVELSRGQISLSPENGDTVIVFFSSYRGKLSEIPPSTYLWNKDKWSTVYSCDWSKNFSTLCPCSHLCQKLWERMNNNPPELGELEIINTGVLSLSSPFAMCLSSKERAFWPQAFNDKSIIDLCDCWVTSATGFESCSVWQYDTPTTTRSANWSKPSRCHSETFLLVFKRNSSNTRPRCRSLLTNKESSWFVARRLRKQQFQHMGTHL